jgi:hypothetical protein
VREDIWLFGGIFKGLARHPDRYEVQLTEIASLEKAEIRSRNHTRIPLKKTRFCLNLSVGPLK